MKKQTVNYGIGYKVTCLPHIMLTGSGSHRSRLFHYANNELGEGSPFAVFEVNSGKPNEIGVFIVLKDPFKLGANLLGPAVRLGRAINDIGLAYVGKLGEVGGLYIEES